MDSGVLARVLDDVLEYGGDYAIDSFDVGTTHEDESYARDRGPRRGRRRPAAAADAAADPRRQPGRPRRGGDRGRRRPDGVFPDDFYSTTNLDTVVRLDGHWVPVEQPRDGLRPGRRRRRRAARAHRADDRRAGRRRRSSAAPPASGSSCRRAERRRGRSAFGFMDVRRCPARSRRRCWCARSPSGMREAKAAGQQGPVGRRPGGRPHRRRAGDGARWSRPATSTCCSPATRWPPTTSSPRCTAPRSASTWPRAAASSTATSTTSARSTRSARPARSRRRSSRAC